MIFDVDVKAVITSDQHFKHANILRFTGDDGELIRPGFSSVDEMDEYMIDRWNSVVNRDDKVYHLGDLTMTSSARAIDSLMSRLNGRKVLIKGNHDRARLGIYWRNFLDVRSEIHMKTRHGDMVIFTHRPILLGHSEFNRKTVFNVHGHIHQNLINDPRYINVCVEQTAYKPLTWEQIQDIIEVRKGEVQ